MTNFKIIILFALIACIVAAPVSAEYYEEEITDYYYSVWQKQDTAATHNYQPSTFQYLSLHNPDKTTYTGCYYIAGTAISITNSAIASSFEGYDREPGMDVIIYDSAAKNYIVGEGTMNYYVEQYQADTELYYVDYTIHLNSWNIDAIVENSTDLLYYENSDGVYPTNAYDPSVNINYASTYANSNAITISSAGAGYYCPTYASYQYLGNTVYRYPLVVTAYKDFWSFSYFTDYQLGSENRISFDANIPTYYNISSGGIYLEYTESGTRDIDYFHPMALNITNPFTKEVIYRNIPTDSTDSVDILCKVWSTDGPLIAGVEINFTAVDDSDQVIETLSTGQGLVTLIPDLTYYVSAEAEGYRAQSHTIDTVTFSALSTNYGHFLVPILNASAGNGTLNFQAYTYTSSGSLTPLENAMIVINDRALITNSVGHASIEVNRTDTISYVASKTGYESVTRTYTPSWPDGYDYILEVVTLSKEGYVGPGEESPEETPDTRTDNEKAESAFSMIMDNIEGLTALGLCVVIMSFIGWIKP